MEKEDREVSIVEPVSIQNTKPNLSISLRGSLAENYYNLTKVSKKNDADSLINTLLTSNNPDLIRFREEECIVVGLRSEVGRYFPDW